MAKEGITLSRRKIGQILRKYGLESKHGRKRLFKNQYTMKSNEERYIAENLLKNIKITKPNEVVCMDTSELKYRDGKLYISAAIDAYSKQVVYCISDKDNTELATETIKLALNKLGRFEIIHTDRALVYSANATKQLLETNEVERSMSRPYKPVDNAYIESFFKTLKVEIGRTTNFTKEQLLGILRGYINYYNKKRIHSSLGYLTPFEFTKEAMKKVA